MTDGEILLACASTDDASAIALIESNPAYEGLVGRWPVERHVEEMRQSSSRYFILRDGRCHVAGFALVQGFGDTDRKLHLKRIAVRTAGQGLGSRLLAELLTWIFTQTETNRVDLDVFEGNDRARRAYERAGFKIEGLLRDYHRNKDGSFASMWLMSILRREWQARRQN